jgi:hypothetical protein
MKHHKLLNIISGLILGILLIKASNTTGTLAMVRAPTTQLASIPNSTNIQRLGPPYTSFVNVSNNPNVVDTLPSVDSDLFSHMHVAWMGTHTSAGAPDGVSTDVFYSKGENTTFTVPISIPVTTGYYSKDVTIAADKDGYAHIAFKRSDDQVWDTLFDDIYYATNRSGVFTSTLVVDGGDELIPEAPPFANAGPARPSIAVDNTGVVHIVYLSTAATQLFYVNNSTGAFTTWIEVPGGETWSVSSFQAAVDDLGNIHIAFKGQSETDEWGDIFYTNNVGGSFGVPINLSDAGIEYDVSLAVDSNGKAHVVYDRMDSPRICYVTNKNGSFSPPICFGYGGKPNIALDKDGFVHIAYVSGNVMYANNVDGTFSPMQLTDNGSLTNTNRGSRWFDVSDDDMLHLVFHAGFYSPPESFEVYWLGVPKERQITNKIYLPFVIE